MPPGESLRLARNTWAYSDPQLFKTVLIHSISKSVVETGNTFLAVFINMLSPSLSFLCLLMLVCSAAAHSQMVEPQSTSPRVSFSMLILDWASQSLATYWPFHLYRCVVGEATRTPRTALAHAICVPLWADTPTLKRQITPPQFIAVVKGSPSNTKGTIMGLADLYAIHSCLRTGWWTRKSMKVTPSLTVVLERRQWKLPVMSSGQTGGDSRILVMMVSLWLPDITYLRLRFLL